MSNKAHALYLVERITVEIAQLSELFEQLREYAKDDFAKSEGTANRAVSLLTSVRDDMRKRVKKEVEE